MYLPTPLHEQFFLAEFNRFEFRVFFSSRPVAITSTDCPTIYQHFGGRIVGVIPFPRV